MSLKSEDSLLCFSHDSGKEVGVSDLFVSMALNVPLAFFWF